MSLFQEWKAKLWQEFWAVKIPRTWTEAVKLGGFFAGAGTVGFSVAVVIQKVLPMHSDRIGTGFGVFALGMMIYPYVDYWNRFKRHQISIRDGDLVVLATNLIQGESSTQEFLEGVQYILKTRYTNSDISEGVEYLLCILVLMSIHHPTWNWPDLLTESVFDPLFSEESFPLLSWIEIQKRVCKYLAEVAREVDPGIALDACARLCPGVRIRTQEFLAKRKSVCDLYRQDLMAAAWHPKRVEAWIRQDRWDLLY